MRQIKDQIAITARSYRLGYGVELTAIHEGKHHRYSCVDDDLSLRIADTIPPLQRTTESRPVLSSTPHSFACKGMEATYDDEADLPTSTTTSLNSLRFGGAASWPETEESGSGQPAGFGGSIL